jgi:hypothetical protein
MTSRKFPHFYLAIAALVLALFPSAGLAPVRAAFSSHLEKSHALGDAWAIEATVGTFSSPSYYTLRDDGPHQLTVRMPDGEVLRFTPKLLMDRPYSRLASVLDGDGDDAGQVWLPIQYDQRLALPRKCLARLRALCISRAQNSI